MKTPLIETQILQTISEAVNHPVYTINKSHDLFNDFQLSETQFNYLIWLLENKFSISFPPDAKGYNTPLRIIEFITQN